MAATDGRTPSDADARAVAQLPTNTLVVVDLPDVLVARRDVGERAVLDDTVDTDAGDADVAPRVEPHAGAAAPQHVLRTALARFGPLAHVGVVPELARAVAVFETAAQALAAHCAILADPVAALGCADATDVRSYFGMHVPVVAASAQHAGPTLRIDSLQVPARDKNFLISPPGSPPIGWVQISEGRPAVGGHHDAIRLHAAFNALLSDSTALNFTLDDGPAKADDTHSIHSRTDDDDGASVIGDPHDPLRLNHQDTSADATAIVTHHTTIDSSTTQPDGTPQLLARQILDFNQQPLEETLSPASVATPASATLPIVFIDTPLAPGEDVAQDSQSTQNTMKLPRTALPPRV